MTNSGARPLALITIVMLVSGCAPTKKYRPSPISPPDTAAKLVSRHLSDPGLREYLERNLGAAMSLRLLEAWDLKTLTLAAFYFSANLEAERARVARAEAAVITAGARPNPSLSVAPGIPNPYLFELDFAVPIETHGKRAYRIESAKNLSDAARFNLANVAWSVRSAVRSAMLGHLVAVQDLDLLCSQEKLRSEQVQLLERQLAVGEIARPLVDSARIGLDAVRLAIHTAQGRVEETRASLAAAIGAPVSGLDGAEFSWPDFEAPPTAESLSPARIQREAVLNRLDVRRALAEYAAAESNLKLEIARQYPDFRIGPGYRYEESDNFFTVGFSAVLPIFNRNQGPIAEAEARRKEAASNFLATQAQVIARSETALARYEAALKELAEVQQTLKETQARQEQMSRRAVEVGEADRLALNGVLLQGAVLATARLSALARAQAALGALEDAVQRPLQPGDLGPLTPQSPALNEPPKGAER